MTKTDIFVPHQTTSQLFVPRTDCLKYQNNILSPKNRIKQKFIQCPIKICHVLFCLVLCCSFLYFCTVLAVLQTKRTQVNIFHFSSIITFDSLHHS